ncbi:MAG: hypothetical protein EOP60_05165, partial [Sphingomonadales bacterium]
MFLTLLALVAAPQCAAKSELPRDLSNWSRLGQGLDTRHATLLRARDGRTEARVTIRKAGIFGVAIDREGWIDMAPARGKPLRMASESQGPRCSGIRKIVRYRLRPGTYSVTVAKLRG